MTYSVKNAKTFNTPDGGGYNASLYCGKTKVANIHDGGFGGCPELDWEDTTIGKTGVVNPDQHFCKDFYAFIKTHKVPKKEWNDTDMSYVLTDELEPAVGEFYISDLVDDFLEMKQLKSALKKTVLIWKPEHKSVVDCKEKPTAQALVGFQKIIDTKFTDKDWTMLNTLPLEDAWELWKMRP